jgi:hypothetical protein
MPETYVLVPGGWHGGWAWRPLAQRLRAAGHRVVSLNVLSVDDIALPPGELGWAPRFPNRLGVTPIEVPGSHESGFTRPAELADALLKG